MKSQVLRRIVMAGLMTSILASGLALGAERPATRENAQPVARQKTARKEMTFKSERTDSWLCNNVSAFFCSNLFPTLPSANNNNSATTAVPDRSRHD